MPSQRISKRSVDALECPQDKDRLFLWDEDLAGFGVCAMRSGSKVYVAQYRQQGRSRRMKLGLHGRLTPDEARSRAKEILGAVETGKDPIEERRARRQVRTFKEVAEDFMNIHVAKKRKPKTHAEYGRLLRLHINPALGDRPISNIARNDIAKLHSGLSSSPRAANRCLALFDTVWNWAVSNGELSSTSPTKGLERNPERSRERYLNPEEITQLGLALRLAETVGLPWNVNEAGPNAKHLPKRNRASVVDLYAVAAIRLLMLTGARLREILDARWDYVDWHRSVMFLPDSKTGRKTLYLSDAAVEVLKNIPRLQANPFIIAGNKGGPRADLKRPWKAIVRAAGLAATDAGNAPRSPKRHRT